jgi:hypothetical protein
MTAPRPGMARPTLSRCRACACYIRLSETTCPFCKAAVAPAKSADATGLRPGPSAFATPPRLAGPRARPGSAPTTALGVRVLQSAVWAFGASTLAVATASCGGIATGNEDASADAGNEAAVMVGGDATADAGDAEEEDAGSAPDARNTCDVFLGVDYGAAPCR